MLKILEITEEGTRESDQIVPFSWIHASRPGEDEFNQLRGIGIPPELLIHIRDVDERSRVIKRDEIIYLVVHMPFPQQDDSEVPFSTAPVSLFLLPEYLVTVESKPMGLFEKMKENAPSGLSSNDKIHFVLNLILQAASDYLSYLRRINLAIDEVEDHLQRSLRNREVLQLLNYQKSLVFFSTSLKSIELMMDKLIKGEFLYWSVDDKELAEDALIEIRQAEYQVDIAQSILTQMVDAFASIVSNNLNAVMKFLAAVTIVISIPTLIASIYGMNVPLPGEYAPQSFIFIVLLSILLSVLVIVVFYRMDWL